MIKIDRTYTIKYSKGGIAQYADFRYAEGKLITHSFYPKWTKKDEVPDISKLTCINEILEKIKEFSYCNNACIYLINHAPPFMEKRAEEKVFLKATANKLEQFQNKEIAKFYKKYLKPIILANGWSICRSHVGYPVLVKQYDIDKYGDTQVLEWENVRECPETFEFEYLCQDILYNLGLQEKKTDMCEEHGNPHIWCSHYLLQRLDFLESEKNFIKVW